LDACERAFAADPNVLVVTYDDLIQHRDVLNHVSRFLIRQRFDVVDDGHAPLRQGTVQGRSTMPASKRFANWPQIERALNGLRARLCGGKAQSAIMLSPLA
jgi:hypothetical protein